MTGNDRRRTPDRSSIKDSERHLVAEQRSPTAVPGRPEIGRDRKRAMGKKDS